MAVPIKKAILSPTFWLALFKLCLFLPLYLLIWPFYVAIQFFGYVVLVLPVLVLLILGIFALKPCTRAPYDHDMYVQTTELKHYQNFCKDVLMEPAHSLFPAQIPMEPDKVKFSGFESRFLDGGGHVQLRMKLMPGELEKLDADFERRGLEKVNQYDDLKNGKWSHYRNPYFNTDDNATDTTLFPQDFHFWIVNKEGGPYQRLTGVAISPKRNEIVYWGCW